MPYSYPTTPGVTYAVECAAEVFVTNPQTGAVAVSGDGSATVYFTATDTLYDISDDSAKVVALFKLAPRLKLTLLQGVAGGWLPRGFTELEYLDASGTQYIDTGITPSNNRGLAISAETVRKRDGYVGGISDHENGEFFNAGRYIPGYTWTAGFSGTGSMAITIPDTYPYSKFFASVNFLNSRKLFMSAAGEVWEENIKKDYNFSTLKTIRLFGVHTNSFAYYWRNPIYSAQISERTKIIRDFVPVLRDADGVAGMWDKVSKQFFPNMGTGTFGYRIKRTGETVAPMSLRDPYYVPPSGVYARLVAENELDIIADTDMEADIAEQYGYSWFANTGEAYENFGIVPQEELLT